MGCQFMWTSFYDDFISFSKPRLANNTEMAVCSLFKLLGWAFAESGDKCMPFAQTCEALGVAFRLDSSIYATAFVCNTVNRVEELCADLTLVLEAGSLSSKNAQRLRGRMQFADGQLFGHTGKRCLKALGDFAEGRRFSIVAKRPTVHQPLCDPPEAEHPPRDQGLWMTITWSYSRMLATRETVLHGLAGLAAFLFFQTEVQFFSLQLDSRGQRGVG